MRVALLLILALLSCCGKQPQAMAPADQTYTVRGVVDGLPGPKSALSVHHEAIPSFVGRDGTVIGMREMIMEFHDLGPAADVKDLQVGDPIEMYLEVRWNTEPRMLVAAIRKLPADTALNLIPPE